MKLYIHEDTKEFFNLYIAEKLRGELLVIGDHYFAFSHKGYKQYHFDLDNVDIDFVNGFGDHALLRHKCHVDSYEFHVYSRESNYEKLTFLYSCEVIFCEDNI